VSERPLCAGCDAPFNSICRPARILLWRDTGEVVRICQGCVAQVLLFDGTMPTSNPVRVASEEELDEPEEEEHE